MRIFFTRILSFFAGDTNLFIPSARSCDRHPDAVLVLSPGDIPTTHFYLKRRLDMWFGENVCYVDTHGTSPQEMVLNDSCMVIIVRHAPQNWLRWLEYKQKQLAGVVFLMDDDIPSILSAPELPFRYAVKTAWRYKCSKKLLSKVCSEVWLSTPELMHRYGGSSSRLLEPEYVAPPSLASKSIVYFYHGSWAHQREIEWLVQIVRRVQEAVPNAWFEIMGKDRVKVLFKGIPRVRVVHPMPWQDYLAYAGTVRYQIGLAPCFDTDFNRARSHSKVFRYHASWCRRNLFGCYSLC